jgi:acetoin:2,6-dichlorophenolindophenol oxidoreductase subunit beta
VNSSSAKNLRNLNGSQAIAEAIFQEMERDDSIVLLGEDVGRCGGVFGASRNCQARFGDKRVRDMPIAEMSFTGMGVGMAMAGLRPIVEIMFSDFIGVCLEQIYNAMAKIPYMSGGSVKIPMVIKTAAGNIGSAAQHSQCLWGTLAHLPGMQIVAPASLRDHKGLMAAAIRSDNPVVVMEHKALLLRKAEEFFGDAVVSSEPYVGEIGKAAVVRRGSDITLATLSASVEYALEAAKVVEEENIDVEVIDLRSIVPLDAELVATSASRTGRLLVVDEDYLSFGLSAELVVRVLDLLGPVALRQIKRHAVPDIPIPAAKSLEDAVIPGPGSIAGVLRQMASAS